MQAKQPLERLVVRNLRCFSDTEFKLDPRLTIVIGENGSGKTTIAEVLASLSYGDKEGLEKFPLRYGARTGKAALYNGNRALATWSKTSKGESRRRLTDDRLVFAYGRYRRVFLPTKEPGPSIAPNRLIDDLIANSIKNRTVTLREPDDFLLGNLDRYLVAIYQGRSIDPDLIELWQRLNDSLRELAPGIEGLEMLSKGNRYVPVLRRHGIPLEFSELSDGYQAILVIVFDLFIRYRYLFTSLSDPLDGEATVVIDEVDLHLHPRWQRTVASQLKKLFPKTQFILTTHSPAVVQAAIDNGDHVIVCREKQSEVVAHHLSSRKRKALEGAGVDSLLLEEALFGVRSRYSKRFASVEDRVEEMRKKLLRGTATEDDERQLAEDLDQLQALVMEEAERHGGGGMLAQMVRLRKALITDLSREWKTQKKSVARRKKKTAKKKRGKKKRVVRRKR